MFTKWRLRKHLNVHDTDRYCHYFNNQMVCPFEEIGCKFRHEQSSFCKFRKCENKLCPFRHKDHSEPDKINDNETETETKMSRIVIHLKTRQSYQMTKIMKKLFARCWINRKILNVKTAWTTFVIPVYPYSPSRPRLLGVLCS